MPIQILDDVTKGLLRTAPRHSMPQGTFFVSDNLVLYKGALQFAPGYTYFNNGQVLSATAIMAFEAFEDLTGTMQLVAHTTTKSYHYNTVTTNFDDVTGTSPFTGGFSDVFQADVGPNVASPFVWYLVTNGKDPVAKWDTVANFSKLGGSPTDAGNHFSRAIAMFSGSLFHLNRVEGGVRFPTKLMWSDTGLVETYTGGVASFLTLYQSGFDEGMALEPLSVYLVAYRKNSIHLISFSGAPFYFSQRQVVAGVGLIAPRAVLNLDTKHIFLGTDNVYLFNGVDLETIGDAIHEDLMSTIDPSNAYRSIIVYDARLTTMCLIVPSTTGIGIPDTWWFYDLTSGAWSGPVRNRPVTGAGEYTPGGGPLIWDGANFPWDGANFSWDSASILTGSPQILFGNTDLKAYQIDYNVVTANGTSVTARFETRAIQHGIGFDPPAIETICRQLMPLTGASGLSTLQWFVGISDNPEGPFTFYGPYTIGPSGLVKTQPIRSKWYVYACQSQIFFTLTGLVPDHVASWTPT